MIGHLQGEDPIEEELAMGLLPIFPPAEVEPMAEEILNPFSLRADFDQDVQWNNLMPDDLPPLLDVGEADRPGGLDRLGYLLPDFSAIDHF